MMTSQRIFVTGASGWIGSAVVADLLAAGHAVTGLARSDASAAKLEQAGAQVVRGSLDDLDVLAEAAAASDGVAHLAFKHEQMFSGQGDVAIDADRAAIETLGDALAGSGKPLAIASGLAGQESGRLITEADRPQAGGVASGRTESERMVLALADRDVRGISVRFAPTVHGPGDQGFVSFIANAARQAGVAGYPGDGANHWPAVHRLDAARLVRLALETAPAGTVLHAVAEEGVPMRAIVEALGRQLGLEARPVEDAEAHFGWFAGFAAMDVQASSAATRELLGWTPEHATLIEDIDAGAYTAGA